MCRNITALRGLDPPATDREIEDAARQFVRKVTGLRSTTQMGRDDVRHAIDLIARATQELLSDLPAPRRAPAGPPGR
ncbi:MAG: DUF2277 domain-containing protein [Actinomycetota bacterium]|nr:DUF2277 domain-containing protein [Actinomycetota bacterium]